MFLSEHRSKELLSQYGLAIPDGRMARSAAEAEQRAGEISARKFVVKAQIPAGGRGLAGGIRFAATPSLVGEEAGRMIGSTLVTEQTGEAGEPVDSVYVEAAVDIARSVFIAISFDPVSGAPMLLASDQGGVEFEQRARMDEDTVRTHRFAPDSPEARTALTDFLAGLGIDTAAIESLYAARQAFIDADMALLEVNPFAQTSSGDWVVLDAKIALDSNAAFRHPEFEGLAATQNLADSEMEAQKHNINLVKLSGNIGVVANGAGLGLATNDMVVEAGGKPANFMDIRTTATSFDVARGVELLLKDPTVKAILINVHGGGMTSADTVAEGISFAYARAARKLPVAAYVSGYNAEWGRRILHERKLPVQTYDTMSDAIARVVELAR